MHIRKTGSLTIWSNENEYNVVDSDDNDDDRCVDDDSYDIGTVMVLYRSNDCQVLKQNDDDEYDHNDDLTRIDDCY